jgi:hypothetical protein
MLLLALMKFFSKWLLISWQTKDWKKKTSRHHKLPYNIFRIPTYQRFKYHGERVKIFWASTAEINQSQTDETLEWIAPNFNLPRSISKSARILLVITYFRTIKIRLITKLLTVPCGSSKESVPKFIAIDAHQWTYFNHHIENWRRNICISVFQ